MVLSFTGGKMEDCSSDTAFQIVLRNCSEEAREEARIYKSFSLKCR